MARPKKLKAELVRKALIENRGLIALSADDLGVVYNTLRAFIDSDEVSQEIIKHSREKRRDKAERRLDDAIENGEAWAIAMTLKSDASRGYSERIDVTTKGEAINTQKVDDEKFDRAIQSLARAIGAALPNANDGKAGTLDAAK